MNRNPSFFVLSAVCVAAAVGGSVAAGEKAGTRRFEEAQSVAAARAEQPSSKNVVDFRYAIPWWQSLICLPDDPDKALIGKEGQVLLDFGGKGFRGFAICLRVTAPAGAKLPSYTLVALEPGIPPIKELFDHKFVQPVDYQLGSEYAILERLLQADLLGRKRPAGQFDVGPLVGLPLDGVAIKIDPRRTGK